jgi:hypothetical protein
MSRIDLYNQADKLFEGMNRLTEPEDQRAFLSFLSGKITGWMFHRCRMSTTASRNFLLRWIQTGYPLDDDEG